MKNKKLLTVAALASVMMFSCTKENLTDEIGGVNASKTEQYKTPSELAQMVMQQSFERFSLLSEDEYGEELMKAKSLIAQFTSFNQNKTTIGGDAHLEDIFYIHEGLFNNQYGDLLSESEALERVEQTYTVNVHKDANGDYFMYNNDIATFYNDLATAIGLELDPNNNEIMVLCDLSLNSIDDANGTAELRAGISIAIQLPLPLTPAGPYWAAEQLGTCSQSNGGSDAADYIRAYLNSKVNASIQHCAQAHPGTQAYPTVWAFWHSARPSYALSVPDYYANTYPHFWKSDDNACLGNSNQEWYSLYNIANVLDARGLAYAQNSTGGIYGNLELIYTDYASHDNGDIVFYPGNHSLYHGGMFHYGVVYCQ